MSKTPWILTHDGTGKTPMGFSCERCGNFEKVTPPMPLDVWLLWAKTYMKNHANCKANP